MRALRLVSVCIVVLALACATTGPGGEKSFIIVPASQEVAIGQGMAEEIAKTEKKLPDDQWQTYLQRVGKKIVDVCDRQDIEYQFQVIESDEINAFAAPGGFVYFYTGLLKRMENEGEMAAVMAHEISHVVARHGVKRLQTAMGAALAYQLVVGDKGGEALNAAIQIGLGLTMAGYSRDAERQADNYGIQYMVKAGYDPNAAITMFEKLAAAGGGGSSNVFESLARSHPETQERIDNAKADIKGMTLPKGLTTNTAEYQRMLKRLPK